MREKSRAMAICGMMTALGVAVMLMGGVIPLATFCCPALAGLVLLPVMAEAGRKLAMGAYVAIAALALMLCPDKEAALLFAFLGYYPVVKFRMDRIRPGVLRLAAKLAVFNAAAGATLVTAAYVLGMQAILAEYAAMGAAGLAAFVVLTNVTMILYDRLLLVMLVVYVKKLRPMLMRGA